MPQVTGDASVPALLAAMTSTSVWSDADMQGVVEYLETSKYAWVNDDVRDFLFTY